MHGFNRNEERVGNDLRFDGVGGCHAGAQCGVGLLDGDTHLKHFRVRVWTLFPDVGDLHDLAGQLLGRISVEHDVDLLVHGQLSHIDLIHVGDRLHLREIRKCRDRGIPRRDLRTRALFPTVPFLDVDDHAAAGWRANGE